MFDLVFGGFYGSAKQYRSYSTDDTLERVNEIENRLKYTSARVSRLFMTRECHLVLSPQQAISTTSRDCSGRGVILTLVTLATT